jgi:hypothetical protein
VLAKMRIKILNQGILDLYHFSHDTQAINLNIASRSRYLDIDNTSKKGIDDTSYFDIEILGSILRYTRLIKSAFLLQSVAKK